MRVFIKYYENKVYKSYNDSTSDDKFNHKKYNNTSYIWDRNNGPAYLIYEFGKLIYEEFGIDDKLHRLNSPAIMDYKTNKQYLYVDGKEYENEFEYWLAVGNYRKKKENK